MSVTQTIQVSDLEVAGYFPKDDHQQSRMPLLGQDEAIRSDGGFDHSTQTRRLSENKVSFRTQVYWLLERDLKNLIRIKIILVIRFLLAAIESVVVGSIFWQVGASDSEVPIVSI
jgi:hypothetical protein